MRNYARFLLLYLAWIGNAKAQMRPNPELWPASCGVLQQEKYANITHIAGIDEFPWIARLGFETTRGIIYKCLAVLITNQHLLAPAHCFDDQSKKPLKYVLLGDWNPTNPFLVWDCDQQQHCAPLPKRFEVSDIALHREYMELCADIAIIRLKEKISFTPFIQPICLTPPGLDTDHYIGQYLPYAGFASDIHVPYKVKALVQVTGHNICLNTWMGYGNISTNTHICGRTNTPKTLRSGAALMAVRVEAGEFQNFYLVGLLLTGPVSTSSLKPEVFIRVDHYRDWIELNVQ